jgi:FKBP-type peptidyl-prolyl cis-trans isomerase FkpA
MRMKPLIIFLGALMLVLGWSCQQNDQVQQEQQTDPNQAKQPLEKANRYMVVAEEEQMDNFVRRYGWEMTKTGTGLRYMIYHHGSGLMVERGKIISLEYEVRLLTGDLIYSSAEDGRLTFLVGRGGVPSGVEEGIKNLREGDKAKFILPSHLAYGLLGDDKRIPPRAVLVYDIEVADIQ